MASESVMAGVQQKDSEEMVMESPLAEESAKKSNRSKSASKKRKPAPVTVPKPFNLGLDKRVEERQQYRAEIEKKHEEAEVREAARRQETDEEEKANLKEYRRSLDFKATPIRKYRDFAITPSEKELTFPLAPTLVSTQRRRVGSEGSSVDDTTSPTQLSNSSAPISEAAPA